MLSNLTQIATDLTERMVLIITAGNPYFFAGRVDVGTTADSRFEEIWLHVRWVSREVRIVRVPLQDRSAG